MAGARDTRHSFVLPALVSVAVAVAVTIARGRRAATRQVPPNPSEPLDVRQPPNVPDLGSRDEFILAEIDSSISFLNVELVVCTALLLFNFDDLSVAPVTIIALVSAVTFLLYGGIHFAAAGGTLARGGASYRDACKSIERGNLISEWFGLYAMMLALPVVVEVSTDAQYLGAIALAINAAGYTTYFATRADMLGRFVEGLTRLAIHIFFIVFLTAHWLGVATSNLLVMWLGGGSYMILAMICAALHAHRGEFGITSRLRRRSRKHPNIVRHASQASQRVGEHRDRFDGLGL